MCTSVLYDLYTEDYSADSIREIPVTVQELIHEGISPDVAKKFLELSENLYSSFLEDTLRRLIQSERTISIWKQLYNLCVESNISASDVPSSFHFAGYDVVLSNDGTLIPRDIAKFRLCLEQTLAQVSLLERKLEHEYNIGFTITEDHYWRVVRFNKSTQVLDDVYDSELQSIISRIRVRQQKIDKQLDPSFVAMQIASVANSESAIIDLLEREYLLIDEKDELESLAYRLQEILNQPPVHKLSRQDLLWVFMGKDTCSENKHHLMDIRANFDFYNGTAKKCTIRRCANCKQYQMSFEQLEHIWEESKSFPKVEIIYVGADGDMDGSYWNDRSVFSDYGYTVNEKVGLTASQRQQRLKWIIDHGKRSKQETARFLRRRIRFNGMKPENWLARSKWEEDLLYVQSL